MHSVIANGAVAKRGNSVWIKAEIATRFCDCVIANEVRQSRKTARDDKEEIATNATAFSR